MRPPLLLVLLFAAAASALPQQQQRPKKAASPIVVDSVGTKIEASDAVNADGEQDEKAAEAILQLQGTPVQILRSGQEHKKANIRKGPDGRPLLFGPDINMCKNRISHGKLGGHHYFLSWREPWNKFEDWDWFNGRNFCRERCMDLVSFETPLEFQMFKEVMEQDKIESIYTSGRKCNFKGKGCEDNIFQPINVNGWFWAGAGNKRIPPTNASSPLTFWSSTGPAGKPQPDNYDGINAGKLSRVSDPVGLTVEGLQEWHDEACMAVLNNKYGDGVAWHDVSCHYRSKVVCEDSDALLARALRENPGVNIPEPVPKKPQ